MKLLAGAPGLEPGNGGIKIRCLTTWLRPITACCRHAGAIYAGPIAAGLLDAESKPKYTGAHSLRHFYASWCINPIDRGGQGLPPKVVQDRLGHSSIVMTMDTYGHLFPPSDDAHKRLADAERALLS